MLAYLCSSVMEFHLIGKRDNFDLLDNEQKVVPSKLTVSEYFEKSKLKIIRYFVVTSRKGQGENNSMFINESNKTASVKLLFREDKSNALSSSVPKSIEPHCEIEPMSVHEVTEQHMKTDKIAKGDICLNAPPKSAETENKNKNKLVLMDRVSICRATNYSHKAGIRNFRRCSQRQLD